MAAERPQGEDIPAAAPKPLYPLTTGVAFRNHPDLTERQPASHNCPHLTFVLNKVQKLKSDTGLAVAPSSVRHLYPSSTRAKDHA